MHQQNVCTQQTFKTKTTLEMQKNSFISILLKYKIATLLIFMLLTMLASCDPEEVLNNDDKNPNTGNTITHKLIDINAFPTLTITTTTAEWNKLLQYFDMNKDNEEYVAGDFKFEINGKTHSLSNVGYRLRGNTSRRRPEGKTGQLHNPTNPDYHHVHFALKFDKFNKANHIDGVKKLNLKWFKDDAMYVREVFCYDLFKRFEVWTAPLSSYCRLYLKISEDAKPVYFGVYQILEPVDDDHIANRAHKFAGTNGNLWKANWGADLRNADRSRMGLENITLTSTYEPVYDLKTNKKNLEQAKDQLVAFINNLNNKQGDDFKQWIAQATDLELLLKTYAVNVVCGMWDDYWNNSNNYYFYFDTNGKFYFIPYDYDNTLGTSLLMNDAGRQDPLRWGNTSNPLIEKIIAIPEYKTLYIKYLNELIDPTKNLFHHSKATARISKWHDMIEPYIENDTGEDMYIEDKPASWGNQHNYKLLGTSNNFFIIKAASIPKQ